MDDEAKQLLRDILAELKQINGKVSATQSGEDARIRQAEMLMKNVLNMMPADMRAAFEGVNNGQ